MLLISKNALMDLYLKPRIEEIALEDVEVLSSMDLEEEAECLIEDNQDILTRTDFMIKDIQDKVLSLLIKGNAYISQINKLLLNYFTKYYLLLILLSTPITYYH